VAVAAAFVGAAVQFQSGTLRSARKAKAFDGRHPQWTAARGRETGIRRPGAHKGAIGRWRKTVRQFWAGRNVYDPVPADYAAVDTQPVSAAEDPTLYGLVFMHPNMPLVVMLLTPFGYLSASAAALAFNVLKLAALAAGVLMAARLAGHEDRKIADWVLLLGLLWTTMPLIGDIQHGNTNTFAMAAVLLHLWLFRRGRDLLAGAPLALAICLKMTPGLFLVYWLYQRNWKLLASAAVSLYALAVLLPTLALGPGRSDWLTATWYRNIIRPAAVNGSWYPEHINQSLSGVVSRYFLDGPEGDIYWGPDDDPHYLGREHGWITLAALSQRTARWVLRSGRLAILALLAWAIGWRRLPRADGRRGLHYALVLLGMMLLNQRTWNHHAAVLLPAGVAIWQGVAFGRVSFRARAAALGLVLAAGPINWLVRSDIIGGIARALGSDDEAAARLADVAKAYGPTFYYFLLLFAAACVLAVSLRRSQTPYADQRQPLRRASAEA